MATSPATNVELKLNQTAFQALFTVDGLVRLDQDFLQYLKNQDPALSSQLISYRNPDITWAPLEISEFVIRCAPYFENFIAQLFQIEAPVLALRNNILAQDPIFQFKKYYVQMQAKRLQGKIADGIQFNALHEWLLSELSTQAIDQANDLELSVAKLGVLFLNDADQHQQQIEQLVAWCVLAQESPEGQAVIKYWQSFRLPQKRHYENLVPIEPVPNDQFSRYEAPVKTQRFREGFKLTDQRMSERQVLSEIHYCVYCHKTEGDFCSKGFPVKKNKPELGLKINPAGDVLTGCPLEEKISEMHVLKKSGYSLGALAVIMIDNPMCAATGHRICNDCMKACIYQKQDPVNIPEVETRVLTDVLHLPWGVEIYDLLMRWNPLRRTQYLPKAYNGSKVLVMGMGPAGFTLAHHLLMEGCAVVGADGLKIEPLPESLLTKPIYDFDAITEPLDDRIMAGFGGVAEYGITVRWDKNFLKLIYISLARRALFQVFGGVRFGGAITVESAWQLGFDHIAIAVGAGLARELPIPNSLAPGMRQANDFLMALQLTGAIKSSSLTNLQVRLPAVVIGGGLTGIDTATEVQAYYIKQVEQTHSRYHLLKNFLGETALRMQFDAQSLAILDEFLQHAEIILEERAKASEENRSPNFIQFIRAWGGVSIVYRKSMQESPAYQRNHEEIIKALEEGIYYAEGLEPKGVELDEYGFASALRCRWRIQDEEGQWMFSNEEQTIPARSIFVATGAKPNIAYAFEHKGTFDKKAMNYLRCELENDELKPVEEDCHIKSEKIGVFTTYQENNRYVSFIGDTHPIFHGSVVKAIASAKRSYPEIMRSLKIASSPDVTEYAAFRKKLSALFEAKLTSIKRVAKDWLALTITAPLAASRFAPGQFYRLQNFETQVSTMNESRLQTEAIAALAIYDDAHPDQLSFLIKEVGVSTRIVATWKKDQRIALMGPTGVATKTPAVPETMLIIGDQTAIPYILSIGPVLKKAGLSICFVCQLQQGEAPFLESKIDTVASKTVFLASNTDFIKTLIQECQAELSVCDTLHVIGPASLLKQIQIARNTVLSEYLKADVKCIASVYGPMQCMLKGVCAQCLQWQIDPNTGKRTKAVYACSWQHQPMEIVDFDNLNDRLVQNKMQEKLSNIWLDYLFTNKSIERI